MTNKSQKLPHIGKRPLSRTSTSRRRKRRGVAGKPRKNYYAIKEMNRRSDKVS